MHGEEREGEFASTEGKNDTVPGILLIVVAEWMYTYHSLLPSHRVPNPSYANNACEVYMEHLFKPRYRISS